MPRLALLTSIPAIASDEERLFWAKVSFGGPDHCWEWTGKLKADGLPYGRHKWRGVEHYAHRFAYCLSIGFIAPDRQVCHRCDNPRCVNPFHLFAGTSAENAADRVAKGRQQRGEAQATSKLTEADVREIVAAYNSGEVTQYELAAVYGVNQGAISAILSGATWGHLGLKKTFRGRKGWLGQKNAARTHCANGHPFAGDNLYYHRGHRACRECSRTWASETRRRKQCQTGPR